VIAAHPRPEDRIEVPAALAHLRRFPLDGALFLFDRDTGLSALCDGPETADLRQRAPRVIQLALTNACNLACEGCYRDPGPRREWPADEAFQVLAGLARAGTLEVALGGGEPLAWPGVDELVRRLHDETPLAISLTTNGTLLSRERVRALAGAYGQIRVSAYDDNDWEGTLQLLAEEGARFGLNWLVTPERLPSLERTVLRAVELGCTDLLLLGYNGPEEGLHLAPSSARDLSLRVAALARALRRRAVVKLSACWGERLAGVPRLLDTGDCGAGRDFIALGPDRTFRPCSFHDLAIPVRSAEEVLDVWTRRTSTSRARARIRGCQRSPDGPPAGHLPLV
jgi:MoaA/NifB/PqqE/SkfB family radical SAM enzyme